MALLLLWRPDTGQQKLHERGRGRVRIGIDGRALERKRTGVARYLLSLLRVWAKEHQVHEYYLYFEHDTPVDLSFGEACFTKRLLTRLPLLKENVRELVWEQTILPLAASRDCVDLLFSPAYTTPALFGGATAVTIHDLSYEAHPEWSRPPQRWKLRSLSRLAARKSSAILTDSDFSKQDRKSTRLNSSHIQKSRMPSSA